MRNLLRAAVGCRRRTARHGHVEPRIFPDQPSDRLQTIVRSVCGLLLAAIAWMRAGGFGLTVTILLFVGSVACCTFGAVRHSDNFRVAVLGRSH